MNEAQSEEQPRCEICGTKYAKYVCAGCGREACSSCYWLHMGLCKKCVDKSAVLR